MREPRAQLACDCQAQGSAEVKIITVFPVLSDVISSCILLSVIPPDLQWLLLRPYIDTLGGLSEEQPVENCADIPTS